MFNLSSQDDSGALGVLKYILLRKVEIMHAVAKAHQHQNLTGFEKALRDYQDGALIKSVIRSLTHPPLVRIQKFDPTSWHSPRKEPAKGHRVLLGRGD